MKFFFDLWVCIHPALKKLIMELKIAFLIVVINVSNVLAIPTDPLENNLLAIASGTELQQVTLRGTVTDASTGEALPGVNVVVTGTTQGTTTDVAGKYSIEVPMGSKSLTFSFIGMEPQEISIGTLTQINVTMTESAIGLEEVVVVGYGTQKKILNTGATLHLKGQDLADRLKTDPINSIQGLTPGVTITQDGGQPGAPSKIYIRGMGTIGGTTPLFIVDGVQTASIGYLNSSDIESIDVLKDAASAAIYGSRAANGVILITTKQGKAGKAQVTFDAYYGWQSLAKKPQLLNAQEYAMLMNEKFENSQAAPFFVGDKMDQINAMGEGTDWIDELFVKNVPTQNYSLGLTGGTEQSVYSTGLSYTQQGGILGGTSQNSMGRITLRINSEHKLYGDILKVGENATVTTLNNSGAKMEGRGNYVFQALSMPPILPMYNSDGTYYSNSAGLLYDFGGGQLANPYALMQLDNQRKDQTVKLLGNLYVELQPIKDLKLRSSIGIDYNNTEYRQFIPRYPDLGPYNNLSTRPYNQVNQSMNKGFMWVWSNTASYALQIEGHKFDVVIGSEAQKYDAVYLSASNKNLIFEDYEHAYINNALGKSNEGLMSMSSYPSQNMLLSYFGRINYNFEEKYLVNLTLRSDGSSNFDKEYRRGYFPSVSAGWVMTNESFMESSQAWLTSLKIRGSWGQNGNQNIPPFNFLAPVASNYSYSLGTEENGFLASGAALTRMSNPQLQWERSEQTDLGFDASFFDDKFAVNFDYYYKSTNGWLLAPPISSIVGLGAPFINGGNVINEGVELALTYNGKAGDFGYSINVNGAYNDNRVTEVPNDIIHGWGGSLWDNSQEYYRTQTGFPLGYYWMLKTDGIFQNEADVKNYTKDEEMIQPNALPGDLRYVDQNKDGIINDEDRVNCGDPFPDFVYGINLNLGYKGFGLMINANGVADVQIVQGFYNYARYFPNYTTEALQRWHGEGTSNRYPRLDKANTNWTNNSDIYVYQADYLRLNNITLSYDFARKIKIQPFNQVRLYIAVLNAYTFTNYTGMDPEVGFGQDYAIGQDVGFVPNPRTIMIGVNIKL